MLTSCMIVGTVVSAPRVLKDGTMEDYAVLQIETDQPFRDSNGIYGKNFFDIHLWKGIAQECETLCKPGSIIAIRGRMESKVADGVNQCLIMAEKVAYIHMSERPISA